MQAVHRAAVQQNVFYLFLAHEAAVLTTEPPCCLCISYLKGETRQPSRPFRTEFFIRCFGPAYCSKLIESY